MKLEHFHKHEHEFIQKANDWINQVYYGQKIKTTKFLTPREQQIIQILVNQNDDVLLKFEGGVQNAERRRAILYPAFTQIETNTHTVIGYEIGYNHRMNKLEHRQILGSLTALNIDRNLIGDILVFPEGEIYLCVCSELSMFFEQNFTKVGKYPIRLKPVSLQQIQRDEQYDLFEVIVSSMRLDVLVANIMKASRSQVHTVITEGNVQVNWTLEQNHSRVCQIGDVISIKRQGRFKLMSYKNQTKSGKSVIVVAKTV